MTVERRTVTQTDPAYPADPVPVAPAPTATRTSVVAETASVTPSGGEVGRRIVTLIFGIIQVFIILRIVLLLLNAREGNGLVQFILDVSQIFVAPFVGIFNNDALHASGSILDIAAIAALVGWTILEMIVLWVVNIARREPA
ncbi:MAG TPA: hypothetical protein VFI15_00950 [Candidatus Limnocylindrales bacterium]|nr:hypothetical protein [Candidatus Limnocylindrales bacterium]